MQLLATPRVLRCGLQSAISAAVLGVAAGLQRAASDERSFGASCPAECSGGCSSEALQQDCVLVMAGRVLQDFRAGTGYGSQVWIRDTNTFIEEALEAGMAPTAAKDALLEFLRQQTPDGDIMDLVKLGTFETSKNTVETDQETSLIQAMHKYVKYTNDTAVLDEEIATLNNGTNKSVTVLRRLEKALEFLMTSRFSSQYELLYGATTVDWGDVQCGSTAEFGILMDDGSNPAVDIYDNAMMVLALSAFSELCMLAGFEHKAQRWSAQADSWRYRTRAALWDNERQKWRPHLYFEDVEELARESIFQFKAGSPFNNTVDEDEMYYHGGTSVAILAGLNTKEESRVAYQTMKKNARKAGGGNGLTVGLTVYPPYPVGTIYRRDGTPMYPYMYQNAGDWPWFGGRTVQALISVGLLDEAREALAPMVTRTLRDEGFYEWYDQDNQPQGSAEFHGAAGELAKAIRMLRAAEGASTA